MTRNKLVRTSYLPWGIAKRKGQGRAAVNYLNASLARVESCDVPSAERARAAWLQEGAPSVNGLDDFAMLLLTLESTGYSPQYWNELGRWFAWRSTAALDQSALRSAV